MFRGSSKQTARAAPSTVVPRLPAAAGRRRRCGSSPALPLLVLVFVLLVLVIGAGLLYVTAAHPSLAMPLIVATAGVTIAFTIAGALAAVMASSGRGPAAASRLSGQLISHDVAGVGAAAEGAEVSLGGESVPIGQLLTSSDNLVETLFLLHV